MSGAGWRERGACGRRWECLRGEVDGWRGGVEYDDGRTGEHHGWRKEEQKEQEDWLHGCWEEEECSDVSEQEEEEEKQAGDGRGEEECADGRPQLQGGVLGGG